MFKSPTYLDRAQELSAIFKDNPISPVEKAAYYLEYVARHKGAPFLQPAFKDLYWFQCYLLDVMAFLAVTVLTFLAIVVQFAKRFRSGKLTKEKQT